jgi:UDP-N-acetylmuramate dehydrogenase
MRLTFTTFSEHTSTRTGGEIALFEINEIIETKNLLRELRKDGYNKYPYIVGDCTNIVPRDDLYSSAVLRFSKSGIYPFEETNHGESIYLEIYAGTKISECIDLALEYGAPDIIALSGIPGTVGSLPIQNVGAYGVESSDFIEEVYCINLTNGEIESLSREECHFGYRDSVFKRRRELLIFKIKIRLTKQIEALKRRSSTLLLLSESETLQKFRERIIAIRGEKGSLLIDKDKETWGVGSFFMNATLPQTHRAVKLLDKIYLHYLPEKMVKLSAAALIKFSGFQRGEGFDGLGVSISKYHLLSLVNNKHGKASDFVEAARQIRTRVYKKTGVKLNIEPQLH